MKLATFTCQGVTHTGLIHAGRAIPFSALDAQAPRSSPGGTCRRSATTRAFREALPSCPGGYPIESVQLEAPLANPRKYLAIGMNYRDHANRHRHLRQRGAGIWQVPATRCLVKVGIEGLGHVETRVEVENA